MNVAWTAIVIGVVNTAFWAGVYFGSLRGRLHRMRIRIRDLERAYKLVANRDYRTRFPEDDERH